ATAPVSSISPASAPSPASITARSPGQGARGLRRVAEASLPQSPFLNISLYQQVQAQGELAADRDPFAFEPTQQQIQAAAAKAAVGTLRSGPVAPPAPPPLPFTAVGYSQTPSGQFEAFLAGDEKVYAVREGGQLDNRYRVVKITPAMIELNDESLGRTAELPFPH
ncbi:MAG: hypothetical protein ACRD10_08225, partial [Terriglobia bacterium]